MNVVATVLLLLLTIGFLPKFISAFLSYTCQVPFYSIKVDSRSRMENVIIPETGRGLSEDDLCTWKFVNMDNQSRQVFLDGVGATLFDSKRRRMMRSLLSGAKVEAASSMITYTLNGTSTACPEFNPMSSYRKENLTLGEFQVHSLRPKASLTITMRPQRSQVAMRVVFMDPGYCARDMLAYRNSCHYVTTTNLTLLETMEVIRQSNGSAMKLEGFDSLEDIKGFLRSVKTPPRHTYPIPKPLDFTHPVCIGLFYSPEKGEILSVASHDGKCVLTPLLKPEEILVTSSSPIQGRCGSLRVNESGSPVIDFLDCSQPMPALISFPEMPQENGRISAACQLDCYVKMQDWLRKNPRHNQEKSSTNMEYIIIFVLTGVLIITALIVGLVYFLRLRKKRSAAYSPVQAAKAANGNVATTENNLNGNLFTCTGYRVYYKSSEENNFDGKSMTENDFDVKSLTDNNFDGNVRTENNINGKLSTENCFDGNLPTGNNFDGNLPTGNNFDGNLPTGNNFDGNLPAGNNFDGNLPAGNNFDGNLPAGNNFDGNLPAENNFNAKSTIENNFDGRSTAGSYSDYQSSTDNVCV